MLATSGAGPRSRKSCEKQWMDIKNVYSKSDVTFPLCLPRLADAFCLGI